MRFFSIGLSLAAVVSLTSAHQCRLYTGKLASAVTTTGGASASTIETSTEITAEATGSTSEALGETLTVQSTSETPTISASIVESTTAMPDETSTTHPFDENTTSTTPSTENSVETSIADSTSETTATTAPPSTITNTETPSDTSEASVPTSAAASSTSAAAPLATFSLTSGNSINVVVNGYGFFGRGDQSTVVLGPSGSDGRYWNRGNFNLEPNTNLLRIDDLYVVRWTNNQIYLATSTSIINLNMLRIKCGDVYEGEALSCSVDGFPSINQFLISLSPAQSLIPRLQDPSLANTGNSFTGVDLIAHSV